MGREGKEIEQCNNKARPPMLQLYTLPSTLRLSPDHPGSTPSGSLTPPHHTHASVPFRWEAEPGKPKPCTTLDLLPQPQLTKSLDLPPRLLNTNSSKITKMPSPTTVLEGPYYPSLGRSILESSSFRFLRKRQGQGMSFDGAPGDHILGDSGDSTPLALSSSGSCKRENKGMFGSNWKKIGEISFRARSGSKSEVQGGSFVFSSFDVGGNGNGDGNSGERIGKEDRMSRRKKSSLLRLSSANKNQFWASINGALKQIIPRSSTK